jgi:2-iminobutanoate/2-iminopropanoate deaminase
MAAIKHFAAPAGMTTPPLSFAARTGDLLFVSGIPGFDENGMLPEEARLRAKWPRASIPF